MLTAYHLQFRTGVHLGRPGHSLDPQNVDLETSETWIPADTLFSAICQTWAQFYDSQDLSRFLDRFQQESPPLLLTSAFPFVGQQRLFPKPEKLNWNQIQLEERHLKRLKQVRFLSPARFQQVIDNHPIEFKPEEDLINRGQVWVDGQTESWTKGQVIWQTQTRPRVTIDRLSSASAIWHASIVEFDNQAGLWFACQFADSEVEKQVETVLNVLGDTGLGGERAYGHGLFELEKRDFVLTSDQSSQQFMTLSPVRPRDHQQLSALTSGEVGYQLSQRSGWISGSRNRRRNWIWMLSEGAVLNRCGKETMGSLVDLQPADYPHPVWRYGYAWPVGMASS